MKHIVLIGFLLVSTNIPGISQKVKYKNLLVFLRAENYADADRYLRLYLKEEPDQPHANYSMGKMLQSYLADQDLLHNRDRSVEIADSSLMYLEKALALTTEKYVKKRDEYYEEFKRRDVRSAKFTVSLSDVQLDIEQRLLAVNQFKADLAKLTIHFDAAVSLYDSALSYYDLIVEKSDAVNVLYFNSGPNELLLFKRLISRYDSCIYNFHAFQELLKDKGKNTIQPKLVEKSIEDYPLETIGKPDFYSETVELWNFGAWAGATQDIVLKQIYPLKKRMSAFDKKLKELHDTIIYDSIDARPAIFRLATENVARDIVDFDDSSLPAAIYNYRIAEINYHSAVNYWYMVVADTTHVGVKLDVLEELKKQQRGNTQLLASLKEANNEEERLIFKEFIAERYVDNNGIEELIRVQAADVQNDSLLLNAWLAETREKDKFAYWHDESIVLEVGGQIGKSDTIKFSTIMIDRISDRDLGFYAWMKNANSLSLSFSISPSSRTLDTLYTVPIDSLFSADEDLLNLNFLSDSLAAQQRVWVLNSIEQDKNSKYIVQVFTTHLTEGIGWNKEYRVSEIPKAILFDATNKSFTLTGNNGEPLLLLDENGEEQLVEEVKGEE